MKARTIFYLIGQGIINLFKNRLMSIAAVTTISACIFVISVFYIVGVNVEYILDSVETNLGITVFFEYDTSEERILEIKKLLEVRTEVHEVTYISPEEAWDNFKTSYFEGKEDQLSGFEGDNPLKDSASLVVYFNDLDNQRSLASFVESLPDVRYIRQSEQVVDVMQSINQLVRYASLTLVAILLVISIFLISNTVRLGISTRRQEIEIMKYIGARDSFIRGPFVIEGILIGLVGTAIPLLAIFFFYNQVTVEITSRFALLKNFLVFQDVHIIFRMLVPIAAVIGMLIGLIGSRLTIGRFLKA